MAGTIVAGTLSDGTYSGSVTDTVRGACKAWVNFNGTGTVAIRAAYNVSSITDNGVGTYTVNFTNSISDTNYSSIISCSDSSGNAWGIASVSSGVYYGNAPTVNSCNVRTSNSNGASYADPAAVSVTIFR